MKNIISKKVKLLSVALSLSIINVTNAKNLDSIESKTQNKQALILAENNIVNENSEIDEGDIIANAESDKSEKNNKFFTFDGSLGTFVKAGFNNVSINKATGQYPTESFGTIFGQFNTNYNFLAFINTDVLTRFKVGLGASAAGFILDTTLKDGAPFAGNGLSNGSGANNNYVGGWLGYYLDSNGVGYPYGDNRYFILQNAYLDIETKIGDGLAFGHDIFLAFKGGRYESGIEYYSGYNQGFNIDVHFGYGDKDKNPDNNIKLWWFSSWGRALAYSEWFLDFWAVKQTIINGKPVNYGIHAAGIDINFGGIEESQSGYPTGYKLLLRPFVYFYPGLYESYGLKAIYENQYGNGFGIKATLQGYFLNVARASTRHGNGAGGSRYNEYVDSNAVNINAILQVFFYNYNARVGIYKNFGSANSHFGTYGNPMGFDFWTASVYDIGASISDVINRNAITGYFSGGGKYDLKYGTLSWDILARITRSPRSDEESIAFTISHAFKNNISLGLKAEWYRDTTHAGYSIGTSISDSQPLAASRTDDRSHIFFTFDYLF